MSAGRPVSGRHGRVRSPSARCAAAVLVFAFGAALLGMPAAAQAVALVSNVAVPGGQNLAGVGALEVAQGFRTGSTRVATLWSRLKSIFQFCHRGAMRPT